ncbi:MAG: hypothetical protein K0Q91_1287 [Fibrobacteria bacterium]|jgi:hypothetical protein|nr:hypothetical protein [Fibrobacteria bacterium]
MKSTPLSRLFALALLGAVLVLPAVAGKDKGGQDENHGSKKRAAHAGPQKQAHKGHDAHPGHSTQQSHDWQKQRGWQRGGAWGGHDDWKGGRAKHWRNEHRTWAQRGGYGGYYVPGPQFNLHFGPRHDFRIQSRPVMHQGYPRFYHQGHSFLLVDPYPETWETGWYKSDDVYIDYNDGYYLHNRRRPGFPLAVTIIQ